MRERSARLGERLRDITPESVLQEFGWTEGEPILLSSVREMVLKYERELWQGLARNSYHLIKSTIYGRMDGLRATPGLGGCLQQRELTNDTQTLHAYCLNMLDRRPETYRPGDARLQMAFVFAAEVDRIRRERREMTEQSFSGYDAFRPEKILFGKIPLQVFYGRQSAVDALPDMRHAPIPAGFAEYEAIHRFLRHALNPAETFEGANARIDEIWERHRFPLLEARALKQAIWEFGNHDFLERRGYHLIGSCLVTPHRFEDLMKRRFGIELRSCELTGARKARENYDPEERAELDAGRWGMKVHEASIYRGTVIIDWTSRQFDSSLPIPEIIDVTLNKGLMDRIEIR